MTTLLHRNLYGLNLSHALALVEHVGSAQIGGVVAEQHPLTGVFDPDAVEAALERNAAGVVDFALCGMQESRGYRLGRLDAHLADARLPRLKRRLSAQG